MKNKISSFFQRKLSAAAVAVLVLMLIIPLSALVLEIIIGLELAFALGIMIYSFTKHKKAMPKLVLYFCLISLTLSIGLTRFALIGFQKGEQVPLILLLGRYMGGVSNPIISFTIAIILLSVTVIVITKGSARVSEVTAKFVLDTMNQKLFDIDDKLSNKEIFEEEANKLKEKQRQECDFYSNMDGSSRFLKGIIKANIVITVITLIGGLLIQNLVCKTGFQSALESVTVIVSGNMIVTAIPLLIVSVAIGNVFDKTEIKKIIQMSKSATDEVKEALED